MVVNRIKKNSKYLVFNAFEGNAFIGTIMGTICDDLYGSCAPFLVIENFIVSKENRRKGVGRKLIEELEDAAMQRGCIQSILITDTAREDAQRFYESNGYPKDVHKGYKKKLKPR